MAGRGGAFRQEYDVVDQGDIESAGPAVVNVLMMDMLAVSGLGQQEIMGKGGGMVSSLRGTTSPT